MNPEHEPTPAKQLTDDDLDVADMKSGANAFGTRVSPERCYMRRPGEPVWWVREILLALLIGLAVAGVQMIFDARLSERQQALSAEQFENQQRLSNLQFVRSSPNREFASLDLSTMNMAHLDLGSADFSGADLSRANLAETVLGSAKLSGANLRRVFANGAWLGKAELVGVNAREAIFYFADLRRAYLSEADCRDATFFGAFLDDAFLTDTDFTGANFFDASLRDADLGGSIFTGANLRGSDLRGAKISASTILDHVCIDSETRLPKALLSLDSDPGVCSAWDTIKDGRTEYQWEGN